MEEKALQKPTMVSRLPKFGARPQGSTSSLPNGAGQPLHSQEGKGGGTGVKPNGMVRLASPFSLKLKKGGGSPSPGLLCPPEGTEPQKQGEEGRLGQRPHQPAQLSTPREVKKPSAPGAKVRRSASSVTSATSRSIPQPSKLAPRGGSAQTSSGHSLSAKPGLNGATTRFGLGLQRTGSNPSTGRGAGGAGSGSGSLRDGLSQSSDSLKAPSVDNMVRSQSFTHFKQVPSHTAQPITRSFSFTRATELAKPPTSNLQRTKSLLAKPIPLRAGAVQQGRGPPTARLGGTPSALPSNLKKTLLPTCVPTKAMTLAYRLTRPSVVKQQRPLLSEKVSSDQEAGDESRDSVDTPPVTPDSPSEVESTLPSESLTMEPVVLRESEPSARYLGEVLEDMSLSSTSSLERNDTSEEYMDDFDNLGDGGSMLLYPTHDSGVLQSQPVADDNAPANQTRLCSFLTDSVDWTAIGLTGVKDASGVPFGHSEQMGSPEMDFPHGSSLDLSPSDSSGGTYMWDEEGLEPLGAATHPCGSYDSDLNSLDILNNLDNLESCDLEDDDLMLDVDLPEDGSLHSEADGMSHFDRAERGGRQGHWRRRQQRWSGPDHFHNDNRGGAFQQFDGHLGQGPGRVGARQLQTALRNDGHSVALDDSSLSRMAEDCSSVKSQLLKLKMLLQVGDGGAIQDALESGILSPEPREDTSSAVQVEELLREVEDLREELRSKDMTIAQMTQQVSRLSAHAASCQCQQKRPESRGERRTHHDKATQTPWRVHGGAWPAPSLSPCQGSYQGTPRPPVLQPSSPWPSERLTQERLAKTAPTVDPSDITMTDDRQPRDHPGPTFPPAATAGPSPGPDQLSLLLSSRLRLDDGGVSMPAAATAMGAPQSAHHSGARHKRDGEQRKPLPPSTPSERDHSDGRPRILQSLRLHKKVSVPTLSQEGATAQPATGERPAIPMPASAALLKKRQLPPPTRGLPCFSSGPQSSGPARALTMFGPSRPLGLRELENSAPRPGGLIPPSLSRLPKPKIH